MTFSHGQRAGRIKQKVLEAIKAPGINMKPVLLATIAALMLIGAKAQLRGSRVLYHSGEGYEKFKNKGCRTDSGGKVREVTRHFSDVVPTRPLILHLQRTLHLL